MTVVDADVDEPGGRRASTDTPARVTAPAVPSVPHGPIGPLGCVRQFAVRPRYPRRHPTAGPEHAARCRETGGLSGERLITQFETMTSADESGTGDGSI